MASSRSRTRQARRDRRKAKESNWTREGTVNPKKISHHIYEGHVGDKPGRFRMRRGRKKCKAPRIVAEVGTNVGELLQAALQEHRAAPSQPGTPEP